MEKWCFVNPNSFLCENVECFLVTDIIEEIPKIFLENNILAKRYIKTNQEINIGDIISGEGYLVKKYVEEVEENEGDNEEQ